MVLNAACFLLEFAFFLLGDPILPVDLDDANVQPYVVSSASGEWTARIEPADRFGVGASRVIRTRAGVALPPVDLEFTWKYCKISDDGTVAGVGRTRPGRFEIGELVLAAIGPDGSLLHQERTPLVASRGMHGARDPVVLDLFLEASGRRLLVRVEDSRVEENSERWWVRRLDRRSVASAAREPSERVDRESVPVDFVVDLNADRVLASNESEPVKVMAVREVPGTDLLVAELGLVDRSGYLTQNDRDFVLCDFSGEVSWRRSVRRVGAANPAYRWPLLFGALLEVGESGRFAFWDAAEYQRIEYRVEFESGRALPREVSRIAMTSEQAESAERMEYVRLALDLPRTDPIVPTRRLREVASKTLLDANPSALRDLVGLAFDSDGTPIAVRRDADGGYTSLFLDVAQGVIRELRWEVPEVARSSGWVRLTRSQRGAWFRLRRRTESETGANVMWFDATTGLGVDGRDEVDPSLSEGPSPMIRLGSDGSLRSRTTPRFPDGRAPFELQAGARVGSDGSLWTHDASAVYRLGDDGVVNLTIGAAIDDAGIVDPRWASGFDALGRFWILDGRSQRRHGFDPSGRPVFVARGVPEDGNPGWSGGTVSSTEDGGIVASFESGLVRFDRDGSRVGRLPSGATIYELADDRYLDVDANGSLRVVDGAGTVLAIHEKLPDGRWSGPIDAFVRAADGRVAARFFRTVVFFDREGTPREFFTLPAEWTTEGLDRLHLVGDHLLVSSGGRVAPLLVTLSTRRIERLELEGVDREEARAFGLDPDGGALLCVSGERFALRRFALDE